jgi:hypothetical protein
MSKNGDAYRRNNGWRGAGWRRRAGRRSCRSVGGNAPILAINRGEDGLSGVARQGHLRQGPHRFAPDLAALYAGRLPYGSAQGPTLQKTGDYP